MLFTPLPAFCCQLSAQTLISSHLARQQDKGAIDHAVLTCRSVFSTKFYRLTSSTPDVKGVPDTVSGLLVVPDGTKKCGPASCINTAPLLPRQYSSHLRLLPERASLAACLRVWVMSPLPRLSGPRRIRRRPPLRTRAHGGIYGHRYAAGRHFLFATATTYPSEASWQATRRADTRPWPCNAKSKRTWPRVHRHGGRALVRPLQHFRGYARA